MATKNRRVQAVMFIPVAKDINSILHPPFYLVLHRLSYAVTPGKSDISVEPLFTVNVEQRKLEWAASNGNRYPPYPQVMATAISQ